MANVRAHVALKARVSVINATSGPKEGAQWHNKHHCVTGVIDIHEWEWRWDTAVAILCSGSATTYGTYSRDSIGGLLV